MSVQMIVVLSIQGMLFGFITQAQRLPVIAWLNRI